MHRFRPRSRRPQRRPLRARVQRHFEQTEPLLVALIFPSIFVVLLGPAVLNLMQTMGGN